MNTEKPVLSVRAQKLLFLVALACVMRCKKGFSLHLSETPKELADFAKKYQVPLGSCQAYLTQQLIPAYLRLTNSSVIKMGIESELHDSGNEPVNLNGEKVLFLTRISEGIIHTSLKENGFHLSSPVIDSFQKRILLLTDLRPEIVREMIKDYISKVVTPIGLGNDPEDFLETSDT